MELVRKENETKIVGARYVRYQKTRQPFGLVITDGKRWGWSLCHDKDQFSKRKAWLVARARLAAGARNALVVGVNWYDVLTRKLLDEQAQASRRQPFHVEGLHAAVHSKLEAIVDMFVILAAETQDTATIRKDLEASLAAFDKEVERLR